MEELEAMFVLSKTEQEPAWTHFREEVLLRWLSKWMDDPLPVGTKTL